MPTIFNQGANFHCTTPFDRSMIRIIDSLSAIERIECGFYHLSGLWEACHVKITRHEKRYQEKVRPDPQRKEKK